MPKLPEKSPPPKSQQLNIGTPRAPKRWSFSFRYWKQGDYFGLDNSVSGDPRWFVSLLTKLQDLSKYEIDKFQEDRALQKHWRYHPIDWEAPSIPMRLDECDWIDSDYRDNPTEFPFMQFQVSRALGRVVGFWDEYIFHIVFLDPMHNIQPSARHNYTVFKTKTFNCQFTELLCHIDGLRSELICEKNRCEVREAFAALAKPRSHDEAIFVPIDQEDWRLINDLLSQNPTMNLNDILKSGIAARVAAHQPPASVGT